MCFIISFLWLRNFLHWNVKRSVVCSSSSHGHIGSSVNPNLWKYDLSFPSSVSIVVNSGNTGIFCHSLFLTDGKKALVTAAFPIFVHCCRHIWSPFSFCHVITTSLGILSYTTGPSSTTAAFASLSTNSFPCIPACPFTQPKWIVQFKCARVCVCVCVCVCVSVVCLWCVCVYVCLCVCVCICVYICVYVCMYVCM